MEQISQYKGTFLNHLEGAFRSEDRDLAVELAEALGLAVQEMRFTATSRPLLAGHFNSADRDPTNNIIFLYEMPAVLRQFVDLLQSKLESDPELKEAATTFRAAAAKSPPIMPHFGIRYNNSGELCAVMDKLADAVSPALKERISIWEVPPYKPIEGLPDIRQVFVTTDVLTTGSSGFEQAIELQAVRDS